MAENTTAEAGQASKALPWRAIHAWALYDFASTAFYMNFISTYFALWVVKDMGGTDLQYGLAKSASMLVVALASPIFGAWSDRAGTRKPFIIVSTLVFVGGGMMLSQVNSLAVGLIVFGFANLGLQLSTVFYSAMLPDLVPADRQGRVSSYGRVLGYTGSLTAVVLGMAFATGKVFGHPIPLPPGGSQAVFVPTACLALLASLPIFLTAAPPPAKTNPDAPAATGRPHAEIGAIPALIKQLRTDPSLAGIGVFLLGSFFVFDTINTIRDFMSIYLFKVVGLSETDGSLQGFLMRVVSCSLLGALTWGFAADRLGPKRALQGVLTVLAIGLTGLTFITEKAFVLGLLGPVLGFAFGGMLVTARPLLAQLVPVERRGEFFGLFVLCNDFAAILGPLTWGAVVALLADRGTVAYQAALATQLVFLAIGMAILWRVPDPSKRAVG